MKRTLALILTLCMALSMFSFPALAAETDVAVLESAPLVETETTTPAETPAAPAPAATGDVAAPAAADEDELKDMTVTLENSVAIFGNSASVGGVYNGKAYTFAKVASVTGVSNEDLMSLVDIEYSENFEDEFRTPVSNTTATITITPTGNAAGVYKPVTITETMTVSKNTSASVTGVTLSQPEDGYTFGNVTAPTVTGLTVTANGTEGADTAAMAADVLAEGNIELQFYVNGEEIPATTLNSQIGEVTVKAVVNSSYVGSTATTVEVGSFTIAPAQLESMAFPDTSKTGYVYGTDPAGKVPTAADGVLFNGQLVKDTGAFYFEAYAKENFNFETGMGSGSSVTFDKTTAAGDYVIKIAPVKGKYVAWDAEKDNFDFTNNGYPYVTMTVTVEKADLTITPAKTTYDFADVGITDLSQLLTIKNAASGETVTDLGDKLSIHVVSDGGDYDSDATSAMPSEEGTYHVTYSVKGAANYNDVAEQTFDIEIVKNAVKVSFGKTKYTGVYSAGLKAVYDQATADITVEPSVASNKTYTVTDNATGEELALGALGEVKNVGTYTLTVRVTPTDDKYGYADASTTLELTKGEATDTNKYQVWYYGDQNPEITYDGKAHPATEFAKGQMVAGSGTGSMPTWHDVAVVEVDNSGNAVRELGEDEFSWRVTVTKDGKEAEILNAGTYKISAVIPGTDTTEDIVLDVYMVTVNKADPKVEYTQAEEAYFNVDVDYTEDATDLANLKILDVNGNELPVNAETDSLTVVSPDKIGEKNVLYTAGKHEIKVEWKSTDANYNDVTGKVVYFEILPVGSITLVFNDGEATYDGTTHKIAPATVVNPDENRPNNKPITYVYSDGENTYTEGVKDAGTYTVTATLPADGNVAGATATATFVVHKATSEVTFAVKDEAYATVEGYALPAGAALKNTDAYKNGTYTPSYEWTLNGETIVDEDTGKPVGTDGTLPADYVQVGNYEVTATFTPTKGNEGNLETVTATKAFVIRGSETDLTRVPDAKTANITGTVEYGQLYSDVELPEVSANGKMLAGTWRVIDDAQNTKNDGTIKVKVAFVPEDANYAEVTKDQNGFEFEATLTATKATLTEDEVDITAYAGKYDGQEHEAFVNVTVNGRFASDKFNLQYSKNGSTWTNDPSEITFKDAGEYTVYVKVDGGSNYAEAEKMIYKATVRITTSDSELTMNDLTVPYSTDETTFLPKVYVDGQEIPSKYLTYKFAKYTEDVENASFAFTAAGITATEEGKPYWVRATLSTAAANNEYKSYELADLNVYAQVTITKADVPAEFLEDMTVAWKQTPDKKDDNTFKYDGKLTYAGIKSKLDISVSKDVPGAWEIVDEDTILEVGSKVTVNYAFTNENDKNGFNPVTVVMTPNVTPMDVKTKTDLTLTAESVPYGTDPAEVVVTADGKVIDSATSKELKGTWRVNATELKIGTNEYPAVYVAESGASNYNVVKNDGSKYTVTVTVTKGDPELAILDTGKMYDGVAATVRTSSKSDAKVDLTWYDANGKQMDSAPINPGTYFVQASVVETNIYTADSVRVQYVIEYNNHYDGIEGFVTRLYQVALGRTPDAEGYETWTTGLKSKEFTPEYVAFGFIFSPEFTNKNLSNAEFLRVMYSTFMDREPDAAGYNMWLEGLNSGEYTREFVFNGFVKSVEFTHICERYGL